MTQEEKTNVDTIKSIISEKKTAVETILKHKICL